MRRLLSILGSVPKEVAFLRRMLVVMFVVMGLMASSCSSASNVDQATEFLDQWVADWNAGDEEALFGVFLPDGVLVEPAGQELVGEEVAPAWSGFVATYSMARTSDGLDNGDGSVTFDVEWTRSTSTDLRRLTITMDGDRLVRMVETYQD